MSDLIDCETRDFNRTLFSKNRERAFEIRWAHGSRRFNDSQCTVAELQRRDRGVLRLDLHERRDRAGMNADNIAKKPLEHIDMMTGLVGEYAAIIGPRAAPIVLIVVGLVPAPAHAHCPKNETAESTGLQRLACLNHRNVETILLDDEKLDAGFVTRADHVVRILEPQGH